MPDDDVTTIAHVVSPSDQDHDIEDLGTQEGEIQDLGSSENSDDVVYVKTVTPFRTMTTAKRDRTYDVYFSENDEPANRVGKLGDLHLVKNSSAVFYKRRKGTRVVWKLVEKYSPTTHPEDASLLLLAGSLPEWRNHKLPLPPHAMDFTTALQNFFAQFEDGGKDRPILVY